MRIGARRVRVRQSELTRFVKAGETATSASDEAPESVDLLHDQLVGSLAEILVRAANSDPENMASALRELAVAAQTLADAIKEPAISE